MQGLEGSEVGTVVGIRELRSSITIGKPASELYRAWRDAKTLSQVMGGIAEVSAVSDDLQRWRVRGPLGRSLEWNSRLIDVRPGELLHWESLEGADVPNEGSVSFQPAPGEWGTVVTLHFRFDPPGGVLGDAVVKLLRGMPETLAHKTLRRFKSLMEAGEIPSLEHNPAARASAHVH